MRSPQPREPGPPTPCMRRVRASRLRGAPGLRPAPPCSALRSAVLISLSCPSLCPLPFPVVWPSLGRVSRARRRRMRPGPSPRAEVLRPETTCVQGDVGPQPCDRGCRPAAPAPAGLGDRDGQGTWRCTGAGAAFPQPERPPRSPFSCAPSCHEVAPPRPLHGPHSAPQWPLAACPPCPLCVEH